MSKLATVSKLVAATIAVSFMAVAQTPLLSVTAQPGPHGWIAMLGNDYNQPATAYVLEMTYTRPGKGAAKAVHLAEAVPGDAPRIVIPAAGSRSLPMGSAAWTDVHCRIVAVIYADGATAGDAAVASHLLRVRALALADIGEILPVLQGAAGDAGASREALVRQFAARVADGKAAVRDPNLSLPVQDAACQTVLANLQHPQPATVSVQTQAASLVRLLTRWQTQLRSSLPRLPATQ